MQRSAHIRNNKLYLVLFNHCYLIISLVNILNHRNKKRVTLTYNRKTAQLHVIMILDFNFSLTFEANRLRAIELCWVKGQTSNGHKNISHNATSLQQSDLIHNY